MLIVQRGSYSLKATAQHINKHMNRFISSTAQYLMNTPTKPTLVHPNRLFSESAFLCDQNGGKSFF